MKTKRSSLTRTLAQRVRDKFLDAMLDQALVSPMFMAIGAIGVWVFSSPDSFFLMKAAYVSVLLSLAIVWILSFLVAFGGDRLRLFYWQSLAVPSDGRLSFRQIHVLCEHLDWLRELTKPASRTVDESEIVISELLWRLKTKLRNVIYLFRLRDGIAGLRTSSDDTQGTIEACNKVLGTWYQIDELIHGEPDATLQRLANDVDVGAGVRAYAKKALKQIRIMRQAICSEATRVIRDSDSEVAV